MVANQVPADVVSGIHAETGKKSEPEQNELPK
jgi:hypothetical protein